MEIFFNVLRRRRRRGNETYDNDELIALACYRWKPYRLLGVK